MPKYLTLFIFLLLLIPLLFCTKPPKSTLWGELSPGSYEVGFRVRTFFDNTQDNIDKSERGRPIEVMIWYPAKLKDDFPRLTLKHYMLFVPDLKRNSGQNKMREWLSTGISGDTSGVGKDTLDMMIETQMQAVLDAPIMKEQFPLVLWTTRHGTMVAQSVLCEYLSSHGYVVAFARYGGTPLPLPWEMRTTAQKLQIFSEHLADLNFALERLRQEPDVIPSKASIITWSYAAELAPQVQLMNPFVKLVIGLSSNPLSLSGLYQGNATAKYLQPDSLDVPYVVMTERIGFDGKERKVPAILDKLPADAYFLSFSKLAHGNFNALEGMIPAVFGVNQVQSWSKPGKDAKLGYETISRYTLHFLNVYLKKRGLFFHPEWEKQLPDGFVQLTEHGR